MGNPDSAKGSFPSSPLIGPDIEEPRGPFQHEDQVLPRLERPGGLDGCAGLRQLSRVVLSPVSVFPGVTPDLGGSDSLRQDYRGTHFVGAEFPPAMDVPVKAVLPFLKVELSLGSVGELVKVGPLLEEGSLPADADADFLLAEVLRPVGFVLPTPFHRENFNWILRFDSPSFSTSFRGTNFR